MKIVIAEKVAAKAVRILKEEKEWTVITHEQINGNLAGALPDADALIVRSAVDVNAEVLGNAGKLRVIGRAGVGIDNIDVDAATKAGIAVMNTPGANAVAVAEHTFALMLALSRHITRADSTTKAGKWEKKLLQGTELRGKTLGIIGLGKIGLEVAKRAKAFDMEVLAHDPFVSPFLASKHGVELQGLDEVYAVADYLTLHVALTPQTAGMIGEDSLSKMKHGVRIINCARGELIDDAALAAAILNKHVAGAALDVFVEEPPVSSVFMGMENVILTPHIAGSTNEAQDAVGVQIASQVREYLKRGVPLNTVNMPSLGFEQYREMQPYIDLARSLGMFLGRTASGEIEEISLCCRGQVANWKTNLIRNAAIRGVFFESADITNGDPAEIIRDKGIQLHENDKERISSWVGKDAITLKLSTTCGCYSATGAVEGGTALRLVNVDDFNLDVPLRGTMICFRHDDASAIAGSLGSLLARHDVNIDNLVLGRNDLARNEAASILQVDGLVTSTVLHDLSRIEAIRDIRSIQF